jgi:hypothetical protein
VDLSEATVKMSSAVKKALDGFFMGRTDESLESETDRIYKLLNNIFMDLSRITGTEQRGRERIVYYSAIIALLKVIIKELLILPYF